MKQEKLRKLILDITKGNLRYADPRILFIRALTPATTISKDLGKIMKNNYTYSFPVLVSDS